MDRIKLKVLGVSCSQIQSGTFVLILAEEKGTRRIPVVIGQTEAQSIVFYLEGIKPPRPFSYDLMLSLANAYDITVAEIFIYKLENGVFYSAMLCDNKQTKIKIEARTSDAVALALLFSCPIYASSEILEKAGIIISEEGHKKEKKEKGEVNLWEKSVKELEKLLANAVEVENYELAGVIKKVINHRKDAK
jgi:hypothetical protein